MIPEASPLGFTIVIDGPVASGKGTIAQKLAETLDAYHMNTGLMYRALTLYCIQNNIPLTDQRQVSMTLQELQLQLGDNTIAINGQDVSQEVRQQEVSKSVPTVAAYADVRQEMVRRQRLLGEEKMQSGQVIIVDARDGYVIFPDAVKVYLTASIGVRAQRRFEQVGGSLDEIIADTQRRDRGDMERLVSPLLTKEQAKEKGYVIVDNSDLNEDQTIQQILRDINQV